MTQQDIPEAVVNEIVTAHKNYPVDTLFYSGCDVLIRAQLEAPGHPLTDIDPVSLVQATILTQKRPIFGYRDKVFSRVSSGNRLISGAIQIPYRKSALIRQKLHDLMGPEGATEEYEDVSHNRGLAVRWQDTIAHYKKSHPEKLSNTVTRTPDPMPANIQDWPFPDNFNLHVFFRHQDKGEQVNTARSYMIEGIHILQMEIVMDTSGQPIMESYQFLARDIRFSNHEKTLQR